MIHLVLWFAGGLPWKGDFYLLFLLFQENHREEFQAVDIVTAFLRPNIFHSHGQGTAIVFRT